MTPRITYRPEDNAAYIRLSQGKVLESAEVAPDVVFDYDGRAGSSASNCSMPGRNFLRNFS